MQLLCVCVSECLYVYTFPLSLFVAGCSVPPVSDAILPNVLEMIGNSPMVRLDKIAKSEGLKCELCK